MKLEDINQKLTERPGGFGGIVKAKAKKQLSPFMKGRQQSADDEVRLIKVARDIKKDLKAWMQKAFRSSGGAKAPLTMAQFLGWIKKAQPKYAEGIETYARNDKAYAEHFTTAIDDEGKQSSTATDDKVKVRDAGADELEKEIDDPKKGDLPEESGDDKEPEVDTSASIYEARLKAILEADEEVEANVEKDEDVGTNRAITLKDNEIDTLITMGIEKQIELDGGESIIDDPTELASQGVALLVGATK
jgi:hypothetical protein